MVQEFEVFFFFFFFFFFLRNYKYTQSSQIEIFIFENHFCKFCNSYGRLHLNHSSSIVESRFQILLKDFLSEVLPYLLVHSNFVRMLIFLIQAYLASTKTCMIGLRFKVALSISIRSKFYFC